MHFRTGVVTLDACLLCKLLMLIYQFLLCNTKGVVGTWWFVPAEADAHFSPALRDSFSRATSYSFGSICFGSFLVALIRSLRTLEQYARNNDDMSALVCIIQCILRCIENIIEFFNQWAYVYVVSNPLANLCSVTLVSCLLPLFMLIHQCQLGN